MADTYDTLVIMLSTLANRDPTSDDDWRASIPGIFERAERRISRDLNLTAFGKTTTGTMTVGDDVVPRTSNIASGLTFEITLEGGTTKPLLWRPLAWMRAWWATPTLYREPRYIAVSSSDKFNVSPPPDQAYPYRYFYRKHSEFLGPTRQTNVISVAYPDLLVAALCYQAALFSRDDHRDAIRATYAAEYEHLKTSIAAAEAAMGNAQYQAGEHIVQGADQ
jgi:hypothetical protein